MGTHWEQWEQIKNEKDENFMQSKEYEKSIMDALSTIASNSGTVGMADLIAVKHAEIIAKSIEMLAESVSELASAIREQGGSNEIRE
jgi:hypothetical protein